MGYLTTSILLFLSAVALSSAQMSRHSRNQQGSPADTPSQGLGALAASFSALIGGVTTADVVTPAGMLRAQGIAATGAPRAALGVFPREGNPFAGPIRCRASSPFRTINGSCNNLERPFEGASKTPLQRLVPENTYEDGINTPTSTFFASNGLLPTAREVSLAVHMTNMVLSDRHSHLMMNFGQFTDHDITLSPEAEAETEEEREQCCDLLEGTRTVLNPLEDCFALSTENDPIFRRTCIPFLRSSPTPGFPGQPLVRFQSNDLTAYIDASQVYGSTVAVARTLIDFRTGKLLTSRGLNGEERLPENPENPRVCPAVREDVDCTFIAGDNRNSEQAALTSVHTLLLREHNRIANELRRCNPHAGPRAIFQNTRKIVGAILQRITYREFLPEVLGPRLMRQFGLTLLETGRFTGYSPAVNASIVTEFSTAAFRFGHSLVRQTFGTGSYSRYSRYSRYNRYSRYSRSSRQKDLREIFEAFDTVTEVGSDGLLNGLSKDAMFLRDRFVTTGLRDQLFGEEQDLPAFNIQRSRDHGVASYNQIRAQLGLRVSTNFNDLVGRTHSRSSVDALRSVYPTPADMEAFPAGLSEIPLRDAIVGETFGYIIAEQFKRLRFGDRFWHETDDPVTGFTDAQLREIRKASLAGLYCENVKNPIVRKYLLLRRSSANPRVRCRDIERLDLNVFRFY